MNVMSSRPDQADSLRQLAKSMNCRKKPQAPVRKTDAARQGVRVISVTSGKGGVGKSNVVVNLAIAFSRIGKRVLLIDADLGVGNIDVLLGLTPSFTLNHVLAGEKHLQDIIVAGPAGIKLVPAGSGVQEYTSLGSHERIRLMEELDHLEEEFDVVIIDTEAGISENVTYFNTAAQEIIVVVSPEPTSITDVYALIKLLATRYDERHFKVLVNMVHDSRDALEVFARLCHVTSRFLDVSLDYLGCVLWDEQLVESVKSQRAVLDMYPDSRSGRCFSSLAKLMNEHVGPNRVKGSIQFLFHRNFNASDNREML